METFHHTSCLVKRIPPIFLVALLAPGIWLIEARGDELNAATGAVDYHPAVTAFFESKEPFVREVVLPNLEANRKSDAELQIVTADGQPRTGNRWRAPKCRSS